MKVFMQRKLEYRYLCKGMSERMEGFNEGLYASEGLNESIYAKEGLNEDIYETESTMVLGPS